MSADAPAWAACAARSTASWVVSAPVPATTGTRPAAVLTTSSVSCLRSATVRVVNSPAASQECLTDRLPTIRLFDNLHSPEEYHGEDLCHRPDADGGRGEPSAP